MGKSKEPPKKMYEVQVPYNSILVYYVAAYDEADAIRFVLNSKECIEDHSLGGDLKEPKAREIKAGQP